MIQHKLSHIHPDAIIGKNVTIDAFVSIQKDVIIGDNTWIGSNATILSGTRIGENCKIFQGAVIGAEPQDLKFEGEYTLVEIGNNVTIREYATVNRGTEVNGKTIIKDNALLMSYVHVAHDCIIGNNCVLASYVGLAGHVEVEDFAILGGYAAVHQFIKIGQHAFIRGASLVTKDVPPFIKAVRDPIHFSGVNIVGLRRRGFERHEITNIEDIYRVIFNKGLNTTQAVDYIKENMMEKHHVDTIINFIENSTRGIIKGNILNGHKVETAV
jgi:UDP-N-acetylglucosamine acyltransferase